MGCKQNRVQSGFTLIEILIVLFICSFITLSGLYQWRQLVERHQLVDATRQISEFIYSQMVEGGYLNRYQILSIRVGKVDWQLAVSNANNNKEIAKITASNYQGIELSKASRTSVQLYGKQGTSRAFSIELKNNNANITIYVSALGRVRACSSRKIVGIPAC